MSVEHFHGQEKQSDIEVLKYSFKDLDVNNDNRVSPADALVVLNDINNNGHRKIELDSD